MPVQPPQGPPVRDAAPPRPVLAGPLLAAKLNPPTTPASQVVRTGIRDSVCNAQSARLVLVRAPAGFGKTTTMMQCRALLEERGVDTSWLTLDGSDNDSTRFLDCLAEAVSGLSGQDVPRSRSDGGAAPADIALAIVGSLATRTAPFALFLDDFEVIQDPAVLGLVRQIIDHLPRGGQLVIGSRSLPDLGLGRLRARGQLLEIDTDRLRFSLDEAGEFLSDRRHLSIQHDDLSRLHRKTEGWVAALWLASVALERRDTATDFIDRFSGSDQAIADYLAEDVLAAQPAPVRAFLLRTSILRQLSAPLCDALVPGADSAALLARLQASNLFLTPIEGEPGVYRYHSLFSDFLRAQCAREYPAELARLHLAASAWYAAQGRPVPAIDHAIDSGAHARAVELLSAHAENLLAQGRMRLLTRWFSALPDEVLRTRPLLQVFAIWAANFTRGAGEAMTMLERSGCADSTDPDVQAHVSALRPVLLAMVDRPEQAYAVGRERLLQSPTSQPFADSTLANAMALVVATMGEHGEAQRLLDAARRTQGTRASMFNRMYSESVEGMLDLREGRIRQATARFRIAVSATRSVSYTHTNGNAWAGVLYAGAMYEANELEQAEQLLNVYLPLARNVGLPDHMILGYVMLSRIAFCRGDIDPSVQALTELEYIGHQRHLPRVVASARLERARLLLLQGNARASQQELVRADDPEVWQRTRRLRQSANDLDYLDLARWRWTIFFGAPGSVLDALDAAIAEAAGASLHRRALKLRILRSLALQGSGDVGAAMDAMSQVLAITCGEGMFRIVADEGEPAALLVRRIEAASTRDGDTLRDPIFTEYLHRLVRALGPATPADSDGAGPAPAAAPAGAPLEPLTRKEIRVLQLLAEGYSNTAMAEKLFVSDSTVRTHLRNINTKLGARSRTQAVALGRRLGLIR